MTRDGEPVGGIEVGWEASGGAITGSGVTNSQGIAMATWTLPRANGVVSAVAKLAQPSAEPVTFHATARYPNLEIHGGNQQRGTVNEDLAEPLAVRVTWGGEPWSGEQVRWALPGISQNTEPDAAGIALAGMRLPTVATGYVIRAGLEGPGAPSVNFVVHADPGPVAQLQWALETGFWMVGQDVAIAVFTLDAFGNRVPDVPVSLTMASGQGSVVAEGNASDAGGALAAHAGGLGDARSDLEILASAAGVAPAIMTLKHLHFVFAPGGFYDALNATSVTVPVGSVVRWASRGGRHAMVPENASLPSGTVDGDGAVFEYRFDAPGTYKWICVADSYEGYEEATTVIVTP